MKLNKYSIKGVKKTAVTAPKDWSVDKNLPLLAQAIRVYENKMHTGSSRTKRRGEVVASTRKIYRQKGTGRARHGALSAPIFVGGGKAHGPDGRKRKLKLPKKMARKALKIAFNIKSEDGKVFLVDGVDGLKKTNDTSKLLVKLVKNEKSLGKRSNVTFALSEKNKDKERFIRNLDGVEVIQFRNLNAYRVFFTDFLLIDAEALKDKNKTRKRKMK